MSAQKTRLLNYFFVYIFCSFQRSSVFIYVKNSKKWSLSLWGPSKPRLFRSRVKLKLYIPTKKVFFTSNSFGEKWLQAHKFLKELRIWTLNRCVSTGLQACLPIYQKDGKRVNFNVVSHEKSKTDISMNSRDIFCQMN